MDTRDPTFLIWQVQRRKGDRGGRFGRDRPSAKFEVVRLSVMREYLERELGEADWSGVRDGFKLERAIDDFVFLCFFGAESTAHHQSPSAPHPPLCSTVGNDFLPHMPGLEIREGAVDALLLLYKTIVSSRLKGYLTCNGEVNLQRLGALLLQLGKLEAQLLASKLASDARERNAAEQRRMQKQLNRQSKLENEQKQNYLNRLAKLENELDEDEDEQTPAGGYARVGRAARVLAAKAGRERAAADDEEELDGGSLGAPPPAPAVAPARGGAERVRESAARARRDSEAVANGIAAFTDELGAAVESAQKLGDGIDVVRYGEPGWKDRCDGGHFHAVARRGWLRARRAAVPQILRTQAGHAARRR